MPLTINIKSLTENVFTQIVIQEAFIMNSEIKNKINTIGKVGRVLTVIAKIIVIAGIVCVCLAGIAGLFMPKDAIKLSMNGSMQVQVSKKLYEGKFPVIGLDGLENGSFSMGGEDYETVSVQETDDGILVDLKGDGGDMEVRTMLLRGCLIGLIYLTAALVMLCFLKSLMSELRSCDTPFASGVIRKMTNFAWSLVPMAVLSGVSFDWTFLANSVKDFHYTINLSAVLVILVVLALVQIFKYGAQLQQQADETL